MRVAVEELLVCQMLLMKGKKSEESFGFGSPQNEHGSGRVEAESIVGF